MFATRFLIFLAPAATYAAQPTLSVFTDDKCKTKATDSNDTYKAFTDALEAAAETMTEDSDVIKYMKANNGMPKAGCVNVKSDMPGISDYQVEETDPKAIKISCTKDKIVYTAYADKDCKGKSKKHEGDSQNTDCTKDDPVTGLYAKFSCKTGSFAGRTTMVIPVLASSLLFVFINAV